MYDAQRWGVSSASELCVIVLETRRNVNQCHALAIQVSTAILMPAALIYFCN